MSSDYSKLVEALRFCFSPSGHGCGWCPYKNHKKPCDAGLLAADAIESLQKELDAANHQLKMYSMCPFDDEEEEEA